MEAVWVAMTMRCRLSRSATMPPRVREEEDRDLAGETDQPQQDGRAGQPVDQPRLRHGLHPGADQRDELAAEEELEVPVFQCAQRGWEGHTEAITRMLPIIASVARPRL